MEQEACRTANKFDMPLNGQCPDMRLYEKHSCTLISRLQVRCI